MTSDLKYSNGSNRLESQLTFLADPETGIQMDGSSRCDGKKVGWSGGGGSGGRRKKKVLRCCVFWGSFLCCSTRLISHNDL